LSNFLQDIARASTPLELHTACLGWYMGLRHVPQDRPWLFTCTPPHVDPYMIGAGLQQMEHAPWPARDSIHFNVRHPVTAEMAGSLGLLWTPGGEEFPMDLAWGIAVLSECPVIRAPGGWGSPAAVIPPNTGASKIITLTPGTLLEELQVAVQTDSFDMMQMIGIRSYGPVRIPGFPKFYWENPAAEQASFKVKGRKLL